MRIQLLLFPLLLMVSAGAQACGTLENWMDAYEGIESGNEWRDSMTQLETLVMMSGCGGSSHLEKQMQIRLSRILLQSLKQKGKLMVMPSTHYEIRDKLKLVRSPYVFDGLIGTIYRRFSCLSEIHDDSLRHRFGNHFCSESEQ